MEDHADDTPALTANADADPLVVPDSSPLVVPSSSSPIAPLAVNERKTKKIKCVPSTTCQVILVLFTVLVSVGAIPSLIFGIVISDTWMMHDFPDEGPSWDRITPTLCLLGIFLRCVLILLSVLSVVFKCCCCCCKTSPKRPSPISRGICSMIAHISGCIVAGLAVGAVYGPFIYANAVWNTEWAFYGPVGWLAMWLPVVFAVLGVVEVTLWIVGSVCQGRQLKRDVDGGGTRGGVEGEGEQEEGSEIERVPIVLQSENVALSQRVKQQEESLNCVVCRENPKRVVLMPCQHLCVCSECSIGLQTCPTCSQEVESRITTY